jgi:hypothetical protein
MQDSHTKQAWVLELVAMAGDSFSTSDEWLSIRVASVRPAVGIGEVQRAPVGNHNIGRYQHNMYQFISAECWVLAKTPTPSTT